MVDFLYTDSDLFILSKPPGIHSVIGADTTVSSVAGNLVRAYPILAEASPHIGDSGLVNRLDFETSGLMLGAWTRPIWESLHELVCCGAILKEYVAITEGCVTAPLVAENFIGNKARSSPTVRVYERPPKHGRALPARTDIVPIKVNSSKNVSLVRATADAARRHQIRAHAQFLGFPLLSDARYGAQATLAEVIPGADRSGFFLHAARIEFTHPTTQERLIFTAPLPAWIERFFYA